MNPPLLTIVMRRKPDHRPFFRSSVCAWLTIFRISADKSLRGLRALRGVESVCARGIQDQGCGDRDGCPDGCTMAARGGLWNPYPIAIREHAGTPCRAARALACRGR